MDPSIGDLVLTLVEKICVIVVIAYIITRTKYFSEILDRKFTPKNQVVLILIFGCISIFGTYSGITIFGAIANVRDLGPMIGGLVGGPLIGIGAGLIGGVHRYLLGGVTCVPCSLATVIAGALGGAVYLLTKGRFIGTLKAILFAAAMEILHMILNLMIVQPYWQAVAIVREVSIPMILSNSIGVGIFAFIISNLAKERRTMEERNKYFDELELRRYELETARQIQQNVLPDSVPHLEGFILAAMSIPAKEVGGDYYDFIPLSDNEVGLTIADVSGKSIPAALFMTLSRTIVRVNATQSKGASQAIQDANKSIAADAKSGMFVTLFYGILNVRERTLTYVNAGHNPPVMMKNGNGEFIKLCGKGIALGVLDDIKLEERQLVMRSGDVVVFYTDGVTEAMNKKGEQFGERRFLRVIRENHNSHPDVLLDKIKNELSSFSGDAPQFDDITLMVLKAE